MNTKIKVTKAQVKPIVAATFPEYSGRKYRVEFSETVCFYDLNWGGGTRNTYRAIKMSNAQVAQVPSGSPWNNPIEGKTVDLPEDVVVVQHTIFCGQDLGLTMYAHPSRSRMLEAK